jgi:hypothetical protein
LLQPENLFALKVRRSGAVSVLIEYTGWPEFALILHEERMALKLPPLSLAAWNNCLLLEVWFPKWF